MPSSKAFYTWLKLHEYCSNNYARAREERADKFAEEIKAIADAPLPVAEDENGNVKMDAVRAELEKRRQQIDARKWMAGRMNPKNWGDRIAHTGADGGPIKHEEVNPIDKISSQLDSLSKREAESEDTGKLH